VPRSVAYAQLAGLPSVYGLYAAFLPVIVATLWGSLRQQRTGPTAMLSLMSAAALLSYAAIGSEAFIALSVMLALTVGILRLALGLFRLGVLVNFLSHPLIIGFTNATALIIGLSQLNKLINVPMPRSDWFLADLWVVLQQLGSTHWPTLLSGLGAFGLIYFLQKRMPSLPGVLIAIVVTTLASHLIGFERTSKSGVEAIQDDAVRTLVVRLDQAGVELKRNGEAAARLQAALAQFEDDEDADFDALLHLKADIARNQAAKEALGARMKTPRIPVHQVDFTRQTGPDGKPQSVVAGKRPENEPLGMRRWRLGGVAGGQVKFTGGGEVVGAIPACLPGLEVPHVDWRLVLPLLPAALVMGLLGFMEATSTSKAINRPAGVIPGDHIFKTKEAALQTLDACYGGHGREPMLSA
jgi:MFS superfamily sulfate permease-like transporter